ncbi:glycosyltransferase family 2 protein [Candidatus Pacearchaeota archaeon]|nr:glycosyltransferase family 2 protein [Candidatus Pacearchaeota archaeon]
MRLTIIVPVYNEEKTILEILSRLEKTKLPVEKEILIIDDGSTDNSFAKIKEYIKNKKIYGLIKKENGGKGSAVKLGFKIATGDIITIQDADLEYSPEDYKKLIKPIIEKKAQVVYGSRFLKKHHPLYKIYFLGNKFLTFITKILYHAKITDMETCYKVFRKDIIKNLQIEANHFDIEPEITAKLLKKGIKIKEIPISYSPRTIEEGKKINWKDGLQAIWTLLKYRFKN